MVHNDYAPFCEADALSLLKQILIGVAFVHSLGIIITDLKPENIVMVSDAMDEHGRPRCVQIKLIDFGSAVIHEGAKTVHSHLIQTRHYRAPEVVFKLNWVFSADVWSIGCILVELLYGKMLFNTDYSIDHLNQMEKCIDSAPDVLLK